MSKFYIHRNLPAEHQDMLAGPRILEVPDHFESMTLDYGEGPFSSLKNLRKNSVVFQDLRITNPKRAEKIGLDTFIVRPDTIPRFPKGHDADYEKLIYRILQHSSNGTFTSSSVKGIHLFDANRVRITQLVQPQNSLGVFSARIEVLNRNNGRWITKQRETTFFPPGWNLQTLVCECYDAFRNRTRTSSTEFNGRTTSGIQVVFCYTEDGAFTTVYPIYEAV